MKRLVTITALITTLLTCGTSLADRHLELALSITPTAVFDDSFEFFASEMLAMDSYGVDVRFEVVEIKKTLHLLPFVAYRFARESGYPALANGYMDTSVKVHDIYGGLRMKGWFLPWMGGFAQAFGGACILEMRGELDDIGNEAMLDTYTADKTKWLLGADLGVEFRISPTYMKRKGIKRFNFGGEIGIGFIKRAQTKFHPKLNGGDELTIDDASSVNFGDVDMSGVRFNVGAIFSFL